jgi:enamine deaminase RidA (YjgF/YER057c/UK114 family)
MEFEIIQPAGWAPPRGYANAVKVRDAGSLLFVAGQIAWDAQGKLVGPGNFAAQFERALRNVVTVIEAAGGRASHLVRLTLYVTDKRDYLAAAPALGEVWKAVVGKHYPAMALVQVAELLEPGALVEIEATAALP